MKKLEMNIVQGIYKLEMIFPSSFFDSMEDLPIDLPFEAKIEGLVQYRWMYLFKRLRITHASYLNFYCLIFLNLKHLFNFTQIVIQP
jgi:hypothetical protein